MHITQIIQYKHTYRALTRGLKYVIHIRVGRETFHVFSTLSLVPFPAYEIIFLQLCMQQLHLISKTRVRN
jgi:hypothetical protein